MPKASLSFALKLGAIALFSTACSYYKSPPPEAPQYLRQALQEQEAMQSQAPQAPELDEASTEDLVLNLQDRSYPEEWDQQSYESVSEWLLRIREMLELNDSALTAAKVNLESLTSQEQDLVDKVQGLIRQNEGIRTHLSNPNRSAFGQTNSQPQETSAGTSVPFTIHLVAKDETLFSIAETYYGSGAWAKDIYLWNQGWVRNPNDLMAGVGIVLFLEGSKKEQKIVDTYLRRLALSDE